MIQFLMFLFYLNIEAIKYNYDPRIHIFGNTGWTGAIHSLIAYPFTKAIDMVVYNGIDIRERINKKLLYKNNSIDLCCGIGLSTSYCGIDSSEEMINVAKLLNHQTNKKFIVADAENYIPDNKFDECTLMFGFHEIPEYGRLAILYNMLYNIVNKRIVIVDISTKFNPPDIMLLGEPYILEYKSNIDKNIYSLFKLEKDLNRKINIKKKSIIKNHVDSWIIELN